MKKILLSAAVVAVALSSCGSREEKQVEESAVAKEAMEQKALEGTWNIENIAMSETLNVRPSEITPDEEQSWTFTSDSTFSVQTNCNIVNGAYYVSGVNEIKFDRLASTRMMCPNEDVERALGTVLPEVNSYEMTGDSILRLSSPDANRYVVLTRVAE